MYDDPRDRLTAHTKRRSLGLERYLKALLLAFLAGVNVFVTLLLVFFANSTADWPGFVCAPFAAAAGILTYILLLRATAK